jgi:hypothetical protein
MAEADSGPKLNVKFRQAAPAASRDQLLKDILSRGAGKVHPLFPGATQPDLASIYVIESRSSAHAAKLRRYLQRSPLVDYVEAEPSRRLIR